MSNVLVIFALLAALVFVLRRGGMWRQRARAAEKVSEEIRRARKVQDKVARDPDFRERVRRAFDRP